MECEGTCKHEDGCVGEVRDVLVSGNGFFTPFSFRYCETAIEADRNNGFTVVDKDEDSEDTISH